MEPKSEIRAPARAENKAQVIATLKNKGVEVVKKALPEKTRKWLTEAASHLQRGNGHKALETMSAPPTEVAPTDEGQKLEETVVEQQPEQTAEQKKGLASRLIETKASVHDHAQKAIQLFNLRVAEAEVQQLHGNITPEDARTQLEVLAKDESITPSEFISRSKRVLSTSTQLRSQTEAEQKALEEQVSSRQSDIRWKIDERIRELDRAKGIRKVSAALEKRRLEGQKTSAQKQIDKLEPQVEAKQQLINQITEQEKPIRLKQEEIILTEILQEVQAIRGEYEQLLQEVFLDGTTTSEIREAYIKQVISPEVDKIVEERRLPAEQKDKFYSALQNYLDHREEPQEQREVYRQELNKLFSNDNGFYSVRDSCETLLNGGDKLIVQGLIADMAAADIIPIEAAVVPELRSYDQQSRFSTAFNKAIDPAADRWIRYDNTFGSQILRKVNEQTTWHFPNMPLWQAMKSSKAANEIFGEVIQRQDRGYYTTALDKSLSDTEGGYIDLLRYYPTPDAIRNLVVIAAADSQNYRTVHANWSLDTLSKQPDWKQQLDEAEAVYPSLKTARPVLESWNYREYGNQPNIQQAAGDLASSLFEGNPVDQRLTELATVALPNHSILDILTKRNVIPASEAATLKETGNLLEKLSQETWEKSRQGDSSVTVIYGFSFKQELRKNLFILLNSKSGEVNEQQVEIVRRFNTLSRMILDNQQDYQALSYFDNGSVIAKLQYPLLKPENITILLEAYRTVPVLVRNDELLGEFCRQYEGEQSVLFFRDIVIAYRGQEKQLDQIVPLVGKKVLSQERALELPTIAKDVLESPSFSLAVEFPKLYLETNDGLEFFTQTRSGSLFSLGESLEGRIGERIRTLQGSGDLKFSELLVKIAPSELEQFDKLLSSRQPIEAGQLKWQQLLMGYVRANSQMWGLPKLSEVSVDKINTLFNDPKVRDACLNGLRDQWITYLKSGKPEEMPFSLNLMSEFINFSGGVGPLSQIDSLNTLIGSVNSAFSKETTVERTKLEISQGLVQMEERFARERWSNEDKTDFYNISRDILGAAPSIFSDYLSLFGKLSPSQMRQFSKEIYPLYRTKLVLMEKKNKQGHKIYAKEQLMDLRKDIRSFAEVFNAKENTFSDQKTKLLGEITGLFKERFGIIRIPESFSSEQMRSFTNVSTYLANLHGRTPEKETVLGFYLSLMVNNRWDDFRRGQEINPNEYLVPEKSEYIKKFLQERQRLNPLTPENLGISQEDMPEFLKLLHQETQNVVIGNIETIDVKLNNIILNLRGLEDLDLYTDVMDKQRMGLLLNWGNKKVGSVVARMYQQLANPTKAIQFSEEDLHVQEEVTQIIQERGLTLSPQTLKEHFQDGIKPLATVVNLINFIDETRAEPEIESLKDLLEPSAEVIEVFKKLGEDFKPTSGAMALSQDLSYLDNLVVKREDELKPEEKALITKYTAKIRDQVVKLENVYGQIKNKVSGLRQGGSTSTNPLLQEKLDQIDRIINAQGTQQAITSTTTDNLNTIIENIRECLSCTREGSNNDTDLTFGDMNKFYLYSQTETQQKGSISDELLFVEPITRADGSQGIAFVLDKIYGTNTPTILENQIEAVLKKQRSIKQRFPNAKISVFVSYVAISTGGTSADMLLERFKAKNILGQTETIEVNVAESATGDHYIEFGGGARTAGKRQASGILLSI